MSKGYAKEVHLQLRFKRYKGKELKNEDIVS